MGTVGVPGPSLGHGLPLSHSGHQVFRQGMCPLPDSRHQVFRQGMCVVVGFTVIRLRY